MEKPKMKLGKIIVMMTIVLTPALLQAKPGDPEKGVFVVKTEKRLIGAKIEVFSEKGELITAQTMQKRKMIIDFGDTRNGSYTIKVTKGDVVEEFQYVKK